MQLRMRRKSRKGQGLVEYIIIVAAVAMISLVAVSVFGHKVADQYAFGAGMLPGAHTHDNRPIGTGWFAQVTDTGTSQNATGGVTWNNIIRGTNGGNGGGSNNAFQDHNSGNIASGVVTGVGGSTFVVDIAP